MPPTGHDASVAWNRASADVTQMRLSDGATCTTVVVGPRAASGVGAFARVTSTLSLTPQLAPPQAVGAPSSTMLVLSGTSAASRWVATMPARSLSCTFTSTLRTVAWSNVASRLITDSAEITTRSPSGRLSFTANR